MRIYDHKKKKGENASPGFIVEGCLRAEPYTLPTALVTCGQAASEQRPTRSDRPQGAGPKRAKGAGVAQDDGDRIAFLRYWKSLGFTEKIAFEKKALESTAALNRDCYLAFVRAENGSPDMVSAPIERVRRHCGSRFEDYRDVILVEHFRRLNLESGVSAKPGSP